ncbi:hypothetical protein ALP39_200038 [Pseudomonas marginalis pv. marginalis]|nr:hypothetical protein ALP39_200038 [Pseudomonas marginalis pv. marginalis]
MPTPKTLDSYQAFIKNGKTMQLSTKFKTHTMQFDTANFYSIFWAPRLMTRTMTFHKY